MKMELVVARCAVPFLQRDREILGRAGERAGVRFRAAAAEEQPAEAGPGPVARWAMTAMLICVPCGSA
jgi:hypothetical protein